MKIVITGYTYTRSNLFEVFEFYPEKQNLYFILPNNWKAKAGQVVFKPFKKEGFKIYHSPAYFFHSHYPLLGGLFKGWMPFFVFRLIWLRITQRAKILYTAGEPNLLATLYNGFWAKILGMKHIFLFWENIPYEQKDKGVKLFLKKLIIKANIALADGAICGIHKAKNILLSFKPKFPVEAFLHAGFNVERFRPDGKSAIHPLENSRGDSMGGLKHRPPETSPDSESRGSRVGGMTDLPKALEGKFVFLFVGALGYRKGIHLALEALAELKEKYPQLYFIIVGSGSYGENLKLKVKSLNLEGIVKFIPWMSNEDLPLVYNLADVFLYPSFPYEGWEEQFGYSIAEASLCSLPAISTKSGSIDEVLIDGKTGLMISPNNVLELKEAMEKLINDSELRKQLGENGRKYIVENFSHQIIAKKLYNLFKKVYGK